MGVFDINYICCKALVVACYVVLKHDITFIV